jgi:hypothetical protein
MQQMTEKYGNQGTRDAGGGMEWSFGLDGKPNNSCFPSLINGKLCEYWWI